VNKPWHWGKLHLVKRIVRTKTILQLMEVRYALAPDRIAYLLNKAQIIRGDPHGIAFGHRLQWFRIKLESFSQFL
jgi:hypothetical protein